LVASERQGAGRAGGADELDALLARVALGDRAAFRELYGKTAGKLLGVSLRILRDRASAEEAVQEAYVKIWHQAQRYRPDRGSALGWLVAIQRNQAIDMLRAERHSTRTFEAAVDVADDAPGPEAAAVAAGERARIDACLGELPAPRAQAVKAAYLEGWSYDELARAHDVPLNTMRTWLRRALIRLRECLTR
jgi:RNA polymerase sigma-70 factor, ECF subfamily